MAAIKTEIRLSTLDVVTNNESRDEPYLWVFYLKLDGTTVSVSRRRPRESSSARPAEARRISATSSLTRHARRTHGRRARQDRAVSDRP